MGFIGGDLRQDFIGRIRGADPGQLLAVPIDVGKHTGAAMVCDFWGEIVVSPFEFSLNEHGFQDLAFVLARAEAERDASWVRVGLEQAGHYHRPLHARLEAHGLDVTLFNPAQVKANRDQDLLRSLKSDAIDLAAMAELLIRGKGRRSSVGDDAIAIQAALASHRSRKVKARTALKNQIHANLDRVFPGLSACFQSILDTKVGRLLVDEEVTPDRVRRLGAERLRRFCLNRSVIVRRAKAEQIVDAGQVAFALPQAVSEVHARLLAADVGLLHKLDSEITWAEAELAQILPRTPARILTTIPRVAVVRASNYGGAVGDVTRFRNAAQVYRLSGLVPRLYESAGKKRAATHISRPAPVRPDTLVTKRCGRGAMAGWNRPIPTSPVRISELARTERSARPAEAEGSGGTSNPLRGSSRDLGASMAPGPSSSGSTNVVAWAARPVSPRMSASRP